jgi:hypothetical protein
MCGILLTCGLGTIPNSPILRPAGRKFATSLRGRTALAVLDLIRDEQSGIFDFQGKLRFVLSYQIHSKDEAELRQMWRPDVRVPRLGFAAARVTKGHPPTVGVRLPGV